MYYKNKIKENNNNNNNNGTSDDVFKSVYPCRKIVSQILDDIKHSVSPYQWKRTLC